MAIIAELTGEEMLIRALNSLADKNINRIIATAAGRAATHARKVGTKEIRKVYTAKSGALKGKAQINKMADGAVINIRGGSEPVKSFSAIVKGKGIFVAIKRNKKALIPRSFMLNNRFVARDSTSRLPFHDLYGPSVPQLFGNPDVLSKMEEAGADMFERRLIHEITRRLNV
ncbi:MAG: hypothetical protein K6C05_04580 [Anaerovibrio sp.]|uniref:hypothetical protein n=1 Tax=Anaerovibrio sp. TaxID=1872532 RepID=UPI0025D4DFCC|nr:hypothetical protein [Anaerovibrio sp.]MCR5176105.1 hypothetical protein [Anaerovibrio sp.]